MIIASNGHSALQVPQPAQADSITFGNMPILLFGGSIALYGQTLEQIPHIVQTSFIIWAVIASMRTIP